MTRYLINLLFENVLENDTRKRYINLQDKKGRTPLFHACAHGQSFVVRTLVEKWADLEIATTKTHAAPGTTAIMVCAENGYDDCFDILLDRGADPLTKREDGADAFYLAAMNGRISIVRHIVTTDLIRIVCHDPLDKPTFRGRTPLQTAAFHGHLGVVKLLHEKGAKINRIDDDGFTPLILASYEGHLRVVKWLLRNGADPSVRDKFGDTARESSEICGHTDISNFLDQWRDVKDNPDLRKESVVCNPHAFKSMLMKSKIGAKSQLLARFQ